MNAWEQNILKWAALLHDICKRGSPLFEGKDHVHPFLSGAAMIRIFHEWGVIQLDSEAEEKEFGVLMQLIDDSKRPVQEVWADVSPNDPYC